MRSSRTLLLPGADGAGALVAAEKIVQRMRALAIPVVGRITVSCGAAELDTNRGSLVDALARADRALYRAKAEGRDRAILDEGPAEPSALPARLELDVSATARD